VTAINREVLEQAEKLARKFHEKYEELAPQFGYETRHETRSFDPASPNGRLMIAVCAALAAQQEPDWRHPKIQALIGRDAHKGIQLRLIEQLLENPEYEPTALSMEYWDSTHDKLLKALSAQPPVVPQGLIERCREILEWQSTGYLKGDALRIFAKEKYGDAHNALQCAEADTASEAFKVLSAAPKQDSGV
jgi:hypothetical protein